MARRKKKRDGMPSNNEGIPRNPSKATQTSENDTMRNELEEVSFSRILSERHSFMLFLKYMILINTVLYGVIFLTLYLFHKKKFDEIIVKISATLNYYFGFKL